MMIRIPISTNGKARVSLSVNLKNTTVAIDFLWNERDGHWFMDLESVNGKNYGVRMVSDSLLLAVRNNVTNGGDFAILKDETANDEPLGFDNIGTTYGLYYLDEEDIEVFKDAGLL